MNVIMKSKVTKKGHLCICITHTDFYKNDTIIEINSENDMFCVFALKTNPHVGAESCVSNFCVLVIQ